MAELCRSDIVQVDLSHGLMRKHVGSILATGDKYGNRFGAEIFRDGVPIDIHGFAVTGYFLRPNKDAIFIVGSTAGNTAFVTLPQACYIDAGSFTLALKISSEDYTTTVRIVDGYILLTQTDDLVDPGEAVPTLDDIFAQIAAMEAATERAQAATADAIAAKDNANSAAVNAVNIATEKGDQAIQLAQEEADKQNVKIATLTQETAKNTEAIDSLNKGGLVMKEDFIGQQVNEWLDEHPEATTTVQDHSLTVDKLVVGTLGYVTPQMFGAVGDGVADDTAALKATIAAHDTIRFPYGTYRITDNLDISNKTVIGEHGSEILCTSQTTAREHQICLSGSCHVEGMTFRQIHHGVALVELLGCKQTVLNRCTFIVDNVHTRAILDLYGANEDIIIRDCNFDCRTLDESGAQTTGGVWVREIGEGRTSRNILFEGCKFNHKGVDEALAVWSWYGVVETVTVRDCVFYDYDGASQSVYFVTLSGKDIVMDGCTIHRKQPSIKVAAVMKIGLDTSNNQAVQMDYSVGVKNTTFLLSLPTSGQYVFRGTGIVSNCYIEDSGGALLNINYDEIVHEDIGDYILFDGCIIRLHGFDAQRDIRAHNCDITFTAETLTRAWFTRNVELVNCDIHVTQNNAILFQYGMASNFTVVDNCRFHGSYSASAWTLFHNAGVTQSRIRLKNAELPGKGAYGLAATDGYIANCITQANWSTINNISVTGNIVAF